MTLSSSSSNLLISQIALVLISTNSIIKDRWKQIQKFVIIILIVEDKQISKLSIWKEEYAVNKNLFKLKRQTQQDSAVKKVEAVKNKAANLIIKLNKFKSSEATELIYKIALAAKKESNLDQISIFKTLQKAINHLIYRSKWKKIIEKKLTDLISFNIWKLIKKISEILIISCKWVFLIKYETDDHLKRFKVRLVVREFT